MAVNPPGPSNFILVTPQSSWGKQTSQTLLIMALFSGIMATLFIGQCLANAPALTYVQKSYAVSLVSAALIMMIASQIIDCCSSAVPPPHV